MKSKVDLDEASHIDCTSCKLATLSMSVVVSGYLALQARRLTKTNQITFSQKVIYPTLISGELFIYL